MMMEKSPCKLPALRALLMTVMTMLTANLAQAYDFQVGVLYYNKLGSNTLNVEVTAPPSGKYSGDIVVPASFVIGNVTYKVTAIGDKAFQASTVTSVTLPLEGITTIGGWAFNDCTGLTSFTLPASITSIGQRAFYYCDKLQHLYAEASDPASYNVGSEAFSYINRAGNTCTIYAPIGRSATYQNSDPFKAKNFAFEECVFINSTTFPDKNFRDYILAQDYGADGHLTEAEIAAVTEIKVPSKSIVKLQGIEFFTALTDLDCSSNWMSSLNINYNTALTYLDCSSNQLTVLDVSKNVALKVLNCASNKLSTLDVSNNLLLGGLMCNQNQLTNLDVSKNTALEELYCASNQLVTLHVSNCPLLQGIMCCDNQIYGKAMDELINSLPSLPTPKVNGIILVRTKDEPATGNEITMVQVAAANAKGWMVKTYLGGESFEDYAGAPVIVIDETTFPNAIFRKWILSQDYGNDGYLTEKEIAGVKMIEVQNKNIDDLTGIELFTELETLVCVNNKLTTLDVSKNTKLDELMCDMNYLTTLDVSKNPALEFFTCSYNQLTTLDVSKNPYLEVLIVDDNQIRGKDMAEFIKSLPTVSNGYFMVRSKDEPASGNEILAQQVDAAKEKGWTVLLLIDGEKNEEYAGIPATAIDATNFPDANFRNWILSQDYGDDGYLTDAEIAGVTEISVPLNDIASLKGIEYFTALTSLDCNSNKLTTLDVSKNTALTSLICVGNQLSALDVTKNTALTSLDCSNNKLNALDVSKNTALTELSCENNQLTALDVTKNTSLTTLYCHGNKITTGMQALISSLCQNGGPLYVYSSENDGNKITTEQVAAAGSKGWSVFMWDGSDWVYYDGVLLGDANGDTKVNVADIVAIVSHQKGQVVNGFSLPAADVNYDGKADGNDILLIQKMIMQK